MGKHLLIASVRFLLKYWQISTICILTIVLGIWGSLFFFDDVYKKITRDRNLPDVELVYQLNVVKDNESSPWPDIWPTAEQLKENIPEIETIGFARTFWGFFTQTISADQGDGSYIVLKSPVMHADTRFHEIFPPQYITSVDPSWFDTPGLALISEEAAIRYFGDSEVINKEIILNYKDRYSIKGVFQNRKNSSFSTDFILSAANGYSSEEQAPYTWFLNRVNGWLDSPYILLKFSNKPDLKQINARLSEFSEKYLDKKGGTRFILKSFPELSKTGELYASSGIILLILLMVCSNYINLSVGFALNIAKETGIRNILGGSRRQLIVRILVQNLILISLAVVLSLASTRPFYVYVFGEPFEWSASTLIYSISFIPIIIILAVIYPSWIISRVRPQEVLKGGVTGLKIKKISHVRTGLVSLQTATSVFFLSSFLILISQIYEWKNTPLNWDVQNLHSLELDDTDSIRSHGFRTEIENLHFVTKTSFGSRLPIGHCFGCIEILFPGSEEGIRTDYIQVDSSYLNIMGIDLLMGSLTASSNPSSAWISKSMAERLLPDNPEELINRLVIIKENNEIKEVLVRGIVMDVNAGPLKNINPSMVYIYTPSFHKNLFIRTSNELTKSETALIQGVFSSYYPMKYSSFSAINDNTLGRSDFDVGITSLVLLICFIFAIVIMILGMIGIILNISLQKRKEFSLRRIFGGDVSSIFFMIMKSFLRILIPGFIIGCLATYFLLSTNFQGIPYSNPLYYLAGVFFILFLIGIIISVEVFKTTKKNPAEVLNVNE